jgi:DNA uptake protein ComE-like DNA-binding protein
MPTSGERQALIFLVAVALLGVGARACRERQENPPTKDLDRQIQAVESRPLGKGAPSASRGAVRGRSAAGRTAAHSADSAPLVVPPPAPPTISKFNPLDLDTATSDQIARLPGVSKALAKRIADNRTTSGPFGCLAAIDRIRGVGAATLKRLDTLVSFSGVARPECAQR